jgi:hypothetical protein
MARSVVVMLAAAVLSCAAVPATAMAKEMACASDEEARGFILRHLQSQLMVAALSCNQKEAYNTFVRNFVVDLSAGGRALIAYFNRVGGGTPALNKHVTDLANAAGLSRASDPGFCAATWRVFWDLQQRPEMLAEIAGQNVIPAVARPQTCTSQRMLNKTAAPQEAKAAVP